MSSSIKDTRKIQSININFESIKKIIINILNVSIFLINLSFNQSPCDFEMIYKPIELYLIGTFPSDHITGYP